MDPLFRSLPRTLLLKNARIVDPTLGIDEQRDVLIEDGLIKKTGKITDKAEETMDLSGKVLAPGFMDMHVHLREPGQEHKETIASGCNAAMAGGFTEVCCMPNTDPTIDNAEVVKFIKDKCKDHLVEVHPIGAVTRRREGKELADIAEMVEAGAVAISDDGSPVWDSRIARSALEYIKMFKIPLIEHAEDTCLSGRGVMNEGSVSTRLGLPGWPAIAEEVTVGRDILLAEYTGSRVHIAHISTAGTVRLVREGKARGVNVTAEVTPHHFTLTDAAVEHYDTNTKMNPPLRTQADVDAILEGLKDGTVDVIATDHAPHALDEKAVEFDQAPFGITGLETAVGLAISRLVKTGLISLSDLIEKFAVAPRKILNLPVPVIEEDQFANLTILDPDVEWTFDVTKTRSRSANSPFNGLKMNGRPVGAVHKGRFFS